MGIGMRNGDDGRLKPVLGRLGVLCAWVAIWVIAAWVVGSPIILASPAETLAAFTQQVLTPAFWLAIWGTLWHIALGAVFACALGCVLGIAAARWRAVAAFLGPAMQFVKSAPIVCFIVLMLVWFGASYVDFAAVLLAVTPIYYFSLSEGWRQRSPQLVEMLRLFQVPRMLRFRCFDWPSVQPFFAQSTKVAVGMSWKSGVTAELIGLTFASIGEQIYLGKLTLDTAGLLMWTIVIVLLSWGFEKLVLAGMKRLGSGKAALRRFGGEDTAASPASAFAAEPLRAKAIWRRFDDRAVLQGFSGEFPPGSRTCIMAPTGTGKTTLLGLLMGLDRPDAGEVSRPARMSAVFQETRLVPNLSAAENVVLAAGVSAGRARGLLLQLLPPEAADALPEELSGGMMRCVELCRAMAAPGSCVILDEPFNGLDAGKRELAMAFIEQHLAGRTLVLVSHDEADAERLACDILRLG